MKAPIYQRHWFAPTVLFILTLALFKDVAFASAGHGLAGSDFRQLHYPLMQFVVRTVHDTGTIPLWNPHQFLGYSVVGNPQYGLFYPPNWLLLLFEGDALYRGVGLLVALHIFWLALGTNYLFRLYGAHPIAALGAGIAVAFGGFPSARIYAGHYAVLLTMAWLPMVMAGLRLALINRRPIWAIPGGVALALAVLGGHPQMAYIMGIGLSVQWLYEYLGLGRPFTLKKSVPPLRQFLLMGLIGGLLSAVMWLPAWDYSHKTQRGGESDSLTFANQHAVPPAQLFGLVIPDWFGEPAGDPVYWGEPFYEEMTAYVGILPLLCLPLIWRTRRREIWLFATLALLGVILSLGQDGLLYRLLYEIIPPARDFRAPGRFLFLTSIGLAGIMAITLTEICQCDLAKRRRLLRPLTHYVLPAAIIGLWVWGMVLALRNYPNDLADQRAEYRAIQLAATISFLILAGGVVWSWRLDWRHSSAIGLLLLMCVNSLAVGWATHSLIATDRLQLSPIWQAAERIVPKGVSADEGRVMQMSPPPGIPNGASWTGYQSPQGYDPIAPLEWTRLTERTGQYILDPGSATNRIFGVRYVLSGTPIENYGFGSTAYFENIGQSESGDFWFYENPYALPRAYLVERYEIEPDPAAVRDRIMNGEVDRGDVVLLDADPDCAISGQGGTATITDYAPNQVILQVTSDGPGLLVLTDQYDDDWQVTVDGKSADLLRANDVTRAVCVPSGEHTVKFFYQPVTLKWAGGLFGVGGILIGVVLGGAWWSGRRKMLTVV